MENQFYLPFCLCVFFSFLLLFNYLSCLLEATAFLGQFHSNQSFTDAMKNITMVSQCQAVGFSILRLMFDCGVDMCPRCFLFGPYREGGCCRTPSEIEDGREEADTQQSDEEGEESIRSAGQSRHQHIMILSLTQPSFYCYHSCFPPPFILLSSRRG